MLRLLSSYRDALRPGELAVDQVKFSPGLHGMVLDQGNPPRWSSWRPPLERARTCRARSLIVKVSGSSRLWISPSNMTSI